MASRLQAAKMTHPGRTRDQNEDFCEIRVPATAEELNGRGALFVVADGMGGHDAGKAASQWAVTMLLERYYSQKTSDVATALREAVQAANGEVREMTVRNRWTDAGTTLVCANVRGSELTVANVGDSRAYLIRNDQIRRVTEDHTWVHERVRNGQMTPEQAASDPRRNAITRSLGTRPDVEVDIFQLQLEDGDALVLCTDGLTGPSYGPGPAKDDEIKQIVSRARSPEQATRDLVELANRRGGPDNITTIVLYYGQHRVLGAPALSNRGLLAGAAGLIAIAIVGYGALSMATGSPSSVLPTVVAEEPSSIAVSAGSFVPPIPLSGAPSAGARAIGGTPKPTSTIAPYNPSASVATETSTPEPADVPTTSVPKPTALPAQAAWQIAKPQLDAAWGSDWGEAINLLQRFHDKYPSFAEATDGLYLALVSYAQELIKDGQASAAVGLLQRAQALLPGRSEAGRVLLALTPTATPAMPKPTVSPGARLEDDAKMMALPQVGPPPGSKMDRALNTANTASKRLNSALSSPQDDTGSVEPSSRGWFPFQ